MSGDILKWKDVEAAREAIAAVRSDRDETDWVVISYESGEGKGAQVLKYLCKGVGGVDCMVEHLKDNMVGYCLTRVMDRVDGLDTIKFAFVFWLGERVPRMQRSRTSIHMGPVKKFFGQFHVELQATRRSELSDEIIRARVMGVSGSGSSVLDEEGRALLHSQAAEMSREKGEKLSRLGASGTGEVRVVDAERASEKLKKFRVGDGDDWVAFTYRDLGSNDVVMIGSGQNGVEGVLGCMKDDNVVYALVRKVHRIDQSEVVKLCYIFWIGENIDRMLRARLGTHKGFINSFLSPYHVDLSVSRREELSDSVLEDLIASVSGNKSHVLSGDRSVQGGVQPVQESVQSAQGSMRSASREVGENARSRANRETVQLQFVDKNAVIDAISSVRCDTSDTNWVLVSYEGARRSRTLRLVGFGSGGFGEFKEKLRDDAVGYGLLRLNEVIDESVTVKFVFVNWIGEEVDRMQRAYLSTHKGFVTELFSPFHVDHECTNKSEITEEILTGKIKKAAGTANYILS